MTTIDRTSEAVANMNPVAIAASRLRELERAWNCADGAAFGAAFHDDSEFVDVRGGHHRGVPAIAAGHQGLFASIYAGSTVRYLVESARALTPGCVVAVAGATLDVPGGPMQGRHRARLTLVITDSDGDWAISAFHNTLVLEAP